MKWIFTLALFIFSYSAANSQVLISLLLGDMLNTGKIEFGLTGGVNSARIGKFESNSFYTTWNLGFYFNVRTKEDARWLAVAEVLVKSAVGSGKLTQNDLNFLGIDTDEIGSEGEYRQRINYFYVPLMIRYFAIGRFYLEGGWQIGLRNKAFVEYKADIDNKETVIQVDNRKDINNFDVGVVGGLGYRIANKNGMNLGARYYQGFTSVYKMDQGYLNSSFYVYINIPIGKGKAREAAAKEAGSMVEE